MQRRITKLARTINRQATVLGALVLLALPLSGNSGCATTSKSKSDEPEDPSAVYEDTLASLTEAEEGGKRIDYKKLFTGFSRACSLGAEQSKPHAKACFNAGIAASKQGRTADAVGYYQQALDADPGFKQAVQNLTVAMLDAGNPADALPIYEQYLSTNADDLNMVNNYAGALGESGRHEDAVLREGHV